MGISRKITERQAELNKSALSAREATLTSAGAKSFDTDPVWRHLHAKHCQLGSRLRKITAVENLEAELQQRKIDRANAPEPEAEEKAPKAKAAKAVKAEPKPAKEGKGKAK